MSLYAIIVGTLFDVVFPGSSPFQLRTTEILASSGASLGCRIVNAAPEYLLGRQRLISGVMNNMSRTWCRSRSPNACGLLYTRAMLIAALLLAAQMDQPTLEKMAARFAPTATGPFTNRSHFESRIAVGTVSDTLDSSQRPSQTRP